MATSKSSFAWQFYKKISPSQATCNYCHQSIKCGDGNTSGLRRHLLKHPTEHDKLIKAETERQKLKSANFPFGIETNHLKLGNVEKTNNIWKDIINQKDFCDVTLVCDDKPIETHKMILSSISPLFNKLLKNHSQQHSLLILRGVTFTDMYNILDFISQGEINIDSEHLTDFLSLAEDLEIKSKISVTKIDNDSFLRYPIEKKVKEDKVIQNETKECFTESDNSKKSYVLKDEIKELPFFEEVQKNMEVKENLEQMSVYFNEKKIDDQYLKEHLESNQVNWPCHQCDHIAISKDHLTEHITLHSETEQFSCHYCNYNSSHKSQVKQHIISKHNKAENYECNQCDLKFELKRAHKSHMKSQHEGIQYFCDKCDVKFKKKRSLKIHVDSQHEGILYFCDKCEYKASIKTTLYRHVRSQHEGVRYSCDQCDFIAKTNEYLKQHIKSIHEVFQYFCDQCSYTTTRENSLKRHVKSLHEGIKYVCDVCNISYSHKYILDQHIKVKHTGELQFSCDECGKQYNRNSGLLQHIASAHKGIRHPCDQCDFTATQKGDISRHIKKHHLSIK